MAETNPNGANQYQMDPRQKLCWDFYINPQSETFSNGLQSAIKAGYEEGTAAQITTFDWFVEKLRRLNMLEKAEKVLDEMLEIPVQVLEWSGRGEDAEQYVATDSGLVKIKQDTAKFIAERVGKEIYSNRTELTGKGGKDFIPDEASKKKSKEAISSFLNENTRNTE